MLTVPLLTEILLVKRTALVCNKVTLEVLFRFGNLSNPRKSIHVFPNFCRVSLQKNKHTRSTQQIQFYNS